METQLAPIEARVIGSLIEKQITTPDQYPLSLNALVLACNQKSNRDPVLELDEATVRDCLDDLIRRHLVSERSGFGSRVPKFQQRFCNTEFSTLQFTAQELGILCELLLRGPQTPGELRSHTARLCTFADVGEVEATLKRLMGRESGPLVTRLAREPGRRESRYMQLFTGEAPPAAAAEPARLASAPDQGRLERLEGEVAALRAELMEMREQLERLLAAQGL